MKRLLRYFLVLLALFGTCDSLLAQTKSNIREMHKVKKKETIFGIARDNGLTIQELIQANPEMNTPGYELKKGTFIVIPYPKTQVEPAAKVTPSVTVEKKSAIRLGVMLPLHNDNGDGKRMVEYYRGVLMAVDSLKQTGLSIDVFAWNVAEDANINKFLNDKNASTCDIIIGPLYSKQVAPLASFAAKHDIKVLIPFSINAPELFTNSNLFQVYQSPTDINEATIDKFLKRFEGYNTVIIDCNDTTSKKGIFTMGLRRRMETMGREYNITNLKSSEPYFAKAFSKKKPNVVILNTGRSPELNLAFAKLNNFSINNPGINISMFGYTEWMMYTKYDIDNYYKYNVYIPATFYLNPLSSSTERIMTKYRLNFHTDMMQALPRFAVTGFDHTMFFLKGYYKQGKKFTGAAGTVGYIPVQTPLKFEKIANGGYRNTSLLFVHYKPTHQIETINY
ncbi:MAG: LysM peptidoglycan-binding domain-containing protein [Prevotella sp.]